MLSIELRSRDKFAIGGALVILSAVAWLSTLYQAQTMTMGHAHQHLAGLGPNFPGFGLLLYLGTWLVMMTAMMLPSAGAMIMAYAKVSKQQASSQSAQISTLLFVFGYLLTWGGTGLIAYTISELPPILTMMVPGLDKIAGVIGGVVLIMAGAYQFSSLKALCLSYCRTPLGYILTHWRGGRSGALLMGLHHGLYCIGCCWALMAILFVVGTMNLAGMAALTLVMFVEKVSRHGIVLGRAVGVALIVAGVVRM